GDILLFLDADVLIPSEAPSIALGCLEAESPTVAIQGTYSICHPNHDLPSLYKNTWIAHSFETSPREIGSTFSCFLMIRRDTFLEAGGYDPRCDSAGATDDFELGDRLVRSGVRIVNHPDLRVVHLKRYSLVSLLRNQFRRSRALVRLALERGFVPGVVARRRYGNLGGGFLLRCLLAPALAASVPAAALGCWVPVAVLGALELILAAPFLRFAARAVGLRRVLPFAALGTLDALVCAAGAAAGGLAWLQGRGALASTMRSRAASSRGRRRGL
ncbi:MAG: glycosyltransferase, partial [Deltaproteobacteria bacterium]|nr:glycosyltransferase [Deltaproteobacteria bacterium]